MTNGGEVVWLRDIVAWVWSWLPWYMIPVLPATYLMHVLNAARRPGDKNVPFIMGLFWPTFLAGLAIDLVARRGLDLALFWLRPVGMLLRGTARALDHALERITAREIHRDEFGILYESKWPYSSLRVKVVDPSSSEVHWIRVRREFRKAGSRVEGTVTTAKAAVASSYGLHEDEYDPVRV